MAEIMWTTEHEADIASDLSAFHRIDDPSTIDAPRYFSLASRLAAYAGVIQARVVAEREESREGRHEAHSPASAPSSPADPSRVSDVGALAMLAADGWVEHSTEGA